MTLFADSIGSLRHLLMLTTAVALFLLLLPVIIPLVAFMHWRNDARMRKIAATLQCRRCGKPLGKEATRLADQTWANHLDSLKKQVPPGTRLRTIRNVHAICTNCGLRYRFYEHTGRFMPEE
jgi:hypothetical protein